MFVKIILTLIIFFVSDISFACLNDSDCPPRHSCTGVVNGKGGQCSVYMKCKSNDDCPNNRACIGARTTSFCIDDPFNGACSGCQITSGNYFVETGSIKTYYSKDCLLATSISNSILGRCEMNSLTESMCYINKIVRGNFARYLVMASIITIGIQIFAGKFNPNLILIVVIAVGLMFASFQVINMIIGTNYMSCQ